MNMVVYHERNGYVNLGTITLDPFINLTDDSNITHESPNDPYQPILGAGATTTRVECCRCQVIIFPQISQQD